MARIADLEASYVEMGDPGEATARGRAVGRRREDRLVGSSQATRDLIEQAWLAARSELPVLVLGPPGSDKELVARAIHAWGPRAARAFEGLSCPAVPEALIGRELFGCAAGVYPAVPGEYAGALDRVAGGTLFLERAEALSPTAARGLARALAERGFRREGASESRPLSARLVVSADAALAVSPLGETPHHTIELVALRERPEDILPLAAHYLAAFSEEAGLRAVGFTADARSALLDEPWPGDVRELRERVRQAVRLADGGAVTAEALLLGRDADEVPSFKEAKRAFEARYVQGLLRRCGGNISRAARLARKDRKDFYDVIRRTGLDPTQFR
jgi:two-component system response regulator GlrR